MPSDQFHPDRRSSCDSSSSDSPSPSPTETSDTTPSILIPSTASTPSPPPQSTSQLSPPTQKCKYHPSFPAALHLMSTPLTPFANNETGQPHPEFPKTHLAFHLLTSSQLDHLARHYHQVHPAHPATLSYPFQIRSWVGVPDESYADIETKRRRFGYFIGMPGFNNPENSGLSVPVECVGRLGDDIFFEADWEGCEGDECECEEKKGCGEDGTEEEVLEWMARGWGDALTKAGDSNDGPFRKY